MDLEGTTEVCEWLQSIGVTGVLVKYRVPGRRGALGFSAGGHLTAALSTNFEKRTYDALDEADKFPAGRILRF